MEDSDHGGSILASNRLWGSKSVIRKQRWFYVRTGDGQWWNTKGNRWVARFITIEVNLGEEATKEEREGYLRIFRSEEDSSALKEIPLGQISSVDKKFLRESEARRFPIRAPNGSPKIYLDENDLCESGPEPEQDEFRWGHVILTFSGSNFYGEFCCGTTKVRDEWKEWFEDYLILQETERMGKVAPMHAKIPKLEERHVKDYIKTFLNHQFTGEDEAREVITPCATLDRHSTPTKEVLWSETEEEKATLRRLKVTVGSDGTTLHICDRVLGVKSVDKLTISLNDFTFIATKQWSNTVDIVSTYNPSIRYILTADNVEQRDSWLRWLQYVKAIPTVENDLAEGGGRFDWKEVALTLPAAPNRKANEKKYKCYYSQSEQRLAFKEFPSAVKWESCSDELGRTVYKDSTDGKIRTRDSQTGHPICVENAYDIYEEYFQPKHVTYPQAVVEVGDGKGQVMGEGASLWEKLRAKTKVLLRVSGASDEVRSRTKKRLAVENTEVDYASDQVVRMSFLAPWDTDIPAEPIEDSEDEEEDEIEAKPVEEMVIPMISVEEEPMTLAEAKRKYGCSWEGMDHEERRRVLRGSGGMTEAQAQKEVFALPYSVINNAKNIVGLNTWKKMSYRRQYDECRKFAHLAGPEQGLKIKGFLGGSSGGEREPTPSPAKPQQTKRSFAAKRALMKGLRSGALSKAVDLMEAECNNTTTTATTTTDATDTTRSNGAPSPAKGAGSTKEGDLFTFTTTKMGVAWEGDGEVVGVKGVQEGSVAWDLGVRPGMVLVEVDGVSIRSKEDLKNAREGAKRKGKATYKLIYPAATPVMMQPVLTTPPPRVYHVDITSPTILQPAVPFSLASPPSIRFPHPALSTRVTSSPCSPLPISGGTAFNTAPRMWCYVKERNLNGMVRNKKRWCVGSSTGLSDTITISKLLEGVLQTVQVINLHGCTAKDVSGLCFTLYPSEQTFELQSTSDRDSWLSWLGTLHSVTVTRSSESRMPSISLGYSPVSFASPVLRKSPVTPPRGVAL